MCQLSQNSFEGTLHIDKHLILFECFLANLPHHFQICLKFLLNNSLVNLTLSEVLAGTSGLLLRFFEGLCQFGDLKFLIATELALLVDNSFKVIELLSVLTFVFLKLLLILA